MTSLDLPAWPQQPLFADRERPDRFVFYDCETTGLDRDFDQITQIALVRTDSDFRIADPERDVRVWRCRRLPWVVPAPAALVTTRTELLTLDAEPLLPQEMMVEVAETLDSWGPAFFIGFNSIRFDDEFIRRGFFASLLSPYLMPGVGSLRADAMVIAQAVHALAPGIIAVPPLVANAGPAAPRSFRLQALADANGVTIDPDAAHDALADAMTTCALLRLMNERAPSVAAHMLDLASKWTVIEALQASAQPDAGGHVHPLAWLRVIGGVTLASAVMALGPSPHQPGRIIVADLSLDPANYLGLDDAELARFVSENRFAFAAIKVNAQPILVPIGVDDAEPRTGLGFALISDRMAQLYEAGPAFAARLAQALHAAQPIYPPPVAVEQELYSGGFVARADGLLAERMAQMQPEAMAEHVPALDDPRLREHARRWVYAADRTALSTSDRQRIDDLVRERLLGPGDQPWRTIAKARAEAMELRIAAAARGDAEVTGHCDRIILELFFLEQRQLHPLRDLGRDNAQGDESDF